MTDASSHGCGSRRMARAIAAVAAALAVALAASASPVFAQETKAPAAAPAAKEKAPAAAKDKGAAPKDKADASAGKEQGKQSAWVKICEKVAYNTKDKDGKESKNEKDICLTHHERLEGSSGMVLVSAAIRELEGAEKKSLMIMLPLGMALPPGVRAAVYSKEQWAKAAKSEKIDEKDLKPIELKYSLCHAAGCTAEIEATPEILEQMKNGGGLMVLAVNPALKPIGFPVPLDGFSEALAGKPIDNKEYAKARGQLMAQIRERQKELNETYKKEKEELDKVKTDLLKSDPNPKTDPKKAADAAKAPAAAEKK